MTKDRYRGVWDRYKAWCEQWEEQPLPVTQEKAIEYVVTLARQGATDKTVRQHLAGLRQAHLRAGLPTPVWRHGQTGSNKEGDGKAEGHPRSGRIAQGSSDSAAFGGAAEGME